MKVIGKGSKREKDMTTMTKNVEIGMWKLIISAKIENLMWSMRRN